MEKAARRPSKKARRMSADSDGLVALALRLSKKLSGGEEHEGQNIMFSPLSMYTALGLLAAGAQGETLDEILGVLGATSRDEVAGVMRLVSKHALAADDPSGPLVVTSACSVWCHKDLPLKPAYRKAAVKSFKADARAVDFVRKPEDARKEINRWVAKATKKLITSVLPRGSVHGDTRLVLTNAIYFKGMWENAFSKSRTKEHTFHRLNGSTVQVPFMEGSRRDEYFVAVRDGFKVLKLPYKQMAKGGGGVRYSMCVFLPTAQDGLRSLADKMAAGGPGFLFDNLPTWSSGVKLRLPKFKLSFFCSMKKALKSLGLRAAFTEEADLSDMVEADSSGNTVRLCVEDVFHRAVVEVNEEGTEAAASTANTLVFLCAYDYEPVDFVADHPFAFYIVEEASRAVVFAGHILDPSQTE